jgi:hypothetical protein
MRKLLLVGIAVAAVAAVFLPPKSAHAEDWWVTRKTTSVGAQLRYCYAVPGVGFAMQGTAAAHCAFGPKLADGGSASRTDGGAPLTASSTYDVPYAFAAGTMFRDTFTKAPAGVAYPGVDQCVACVLDTIPADGGGILTIDFYQSNPAR